MISAVEVALSAVAIVANGRRKRAVQATPPPIRMEGAYFVVQDTAEVWAFDVAQIVNVNTETRPTEFPVESGFVVSDAVTVSPVIYTITCVVTKYSNGGGARKLDPDPAWKMLLTLQQDRSFVSLWVPITGGSGYEAVPNMVLSSITKRQGVESGDGLFLTIEFREVRTVSTTSEVAPKIIKTEKKGGKKGGGGKQKKETKQVIPEANRAAAVALAQKGRAVKAEAAEAPAVGKFSTNGLAGVSWP